MRNFTLGAEDSEVSFNVTVFEDGIIESAETFEVVLSAVVGEGGIIVPKGRDRLTVTITDSTAGTLKKKHNHGINRINRIE